MDPLEVVSVHINLVMRHVLEASTTDPKVRLRHVLQSLS